MKETGILMIDEMRDRALADEKTQTRRVCTSSVSTSDHGKSHSPMILNKGSWYLPVECCPFGKPGIDRLYLKEDHCLTKKRIKGKLCIVADYRTQYHDHGFRTYQWTDLDKATRRKLSKIKTWGRWRSKLLMYKFLARTWFEITHIRVEQVQDISPEDAIAEGLTAGKTIGGYDGFGLPSWDISLFRQSPVDAYQWLWNSINDQREDGKYSCNNNPWVWVIIFKRVKDVG